MAGENLIDDDDRVHQGMARPLFIVTTTGPALLVDVTAAPLCVGLTRYCLDLSPDEPEDRVAAGLRSLGCGIRGCYLRLDDGVAGAAEIGPDGRVFATG